MKYSTRDLVVRLEKIRKAKGWSRAQLTIFFRMAPVTFWRWRAGYHGPSIDTYFRVLRKIEETEKSLSAEPVTEIPQETSEESTKAKKKKSTSA